MHESIIEEEEEEGSLYWDCHKGRWEEREREKGQRVEHYLVNGKMVGFYW